MNILYYKIIHYKHTIHIYIHKVFLLERLVGQKNSHMNYCWFRQKLLTGDHPSSI